MVVNDPESNDLSKSGVRMGMAQRTLKRSSLSVGCGLVVCYLLLTLPLMADEPSIAETVLRPEIAAGPLDNPLKGWCPYTNAGEIHQPYSMVFQYVSWKELEPVENEFQFERWEKTWDADEHGGSGVGKHVIFRVYIDYPSLPSGLPDWLRAAGVKEAPYSDYGGGQSPDYNHPIMVAAMERLIAELGKRYNSNPRVAFIQLGLLGFWGEWHTYPRTELYASEDTERRVIDAYRKAFPNKSLMVRYARGYAGQQDWIGFHDDMFPQDTDNGEDWSFLAGLREHQRTDNWKNAVVGGEMVPGEATRWLGKDYKTTQTMLERSHFTWIGPYCPALSESRDRQFLRRCEELIRRSGYEYTIVEVRHASHPRPKQAMTISVKGQNRGVAPFYYPWKVEFALLDQQGRAVAVQSTDWDLRTWQPGEFSASTELGFDAAPGTYRLAIGIRDPWKDQPAIRFANDLPVVNGWTVLSELTLSAAP